VLEREQFLARTAARFRAKTAASRGLNARERDLMEFTYDELLAAYAFEEETDAELQDHSDG